MTTNNAIYLRRRSKLIVPQGGSELLPLNYVASIAKNVAALGYSFSELLVAALRTLSLEQLTMFYQEIIADLKTMRGAQYDFKPLYPNFPAQVMAMNEAELYLNAILHYWTGGKWAPPSEVQERLPLLDTVELKQIAIGTPEEFAGLFTQVASANTSFSSQDKEDARWFVENYADHMEILLPEAIPQKENIAYLAGLLLENLPQERATQIIARFVKTATDILRLAVAMSGGDVSLATAVKFRNFTRAERTLFLKLLERLPNATEDMLRWKGRWIRLGERLHPGEHAAKYPKIANSFAVLRNNKPFTTFNSGIEKALAMREIKAVVTQLRTRPGDFARRLDHLLRISGTEQDAALSAFGTVAKEVSTPVLLQVRHHFTVRNEASEMRVFFPKGQLGKAQGIPNSLPPLSVIICGIVVAICEKALMERFATLPSLGKVYIDPQLAEYKAPFAMRSASKTLRTLVRGSKLPLPQCQALRFFVWWKNGIERTDIDLSATLYNDQFEYVDVLSYYNLKNFGGVHSGDVVDAPEGASEFIDITLEKLRAAKIRYVVMTLNSYTQQPYVELPECFAGWMARQEPGSGEIYEPKTVQDKLDLTADSRIAIPLVIDVQEHKVIWCDISLRNNPRWQNNVHGNLTGMGVTLRAMTHLEKPNLYDLLILHAKARGEQVDTPDTAETIFSVANETPFRLEEIAAEYMA